MTAPTPPTSDVVGLVRRGHAVLSLRDTIRLVRSSVDAWLDDRAPSMGAALAYYTLFSIAPLLLIVISVAGLLFGAEAARGERDIRGHHDVGRFDGLRDAVIGCIEALRHHVERDPGIRRHPHPGWLATGRPLPPTRVHRAGPWLCRRRR